MPVISGFFFKDPDESDYKWLRDFIIHTEAEYLPALRDYGVIFLTAPPYLLVIRCYSSITTYGGSVNGEYVIRREVRWWYRIYVSRGEGLDVEQIHRRPDGSHFPCGKIVNGYLYGLDYFDSVSDGNTVVGCESDDPLAMSWPEAYCTLRLEFQREDNEFAFVLRHDNMMFNGCADRDWSYDTIVRGPRDRLLRILDWIIEYICFQDVSDLCLLLPSYRP